MSLSLIGAHNTSLIICLGVLSAVCAALTVTRRNPVFAIVCLIMLYLAVSMYLFAIGLGAFGLVYILVYVGAIAILFLFILSLINLQNSETARVSNRQDVLLIAIAGALLVWFAADYTTGTAPEGLVYLNVLVGTPSFAGVLSPTAGEVSVPELKVLGELLFSVFAIPMLITGLLLLFTILGVIMLAK